MDDLYQEVILAEARSPKNQGELPTPDLAGTQVNASCGDTVRVTIQLTADKKTISDIRWQGSGCIISQASLSVISELAKGKSLDSVRAMTAGTVLEHLGLTTMSPGRMKCVLLGLHTIQKLIG